jgi:hypothetical protein
VALVWKGPVRVNINLYVQTHGVHPRGVATWVFQGKGAGPERWYGAYSKVKRLAVAWARKMGCSTLRLQP